MFDDCLALISIKSSSKMKGLVNISGFHVDPGYQGRIYYAVFNAGPRPILLRRQEALFQMFVYRLCEPSDEPYEDGLRDKMPVDYVASLQRGRPVSLDALSGELGSLKAQIRLQWALGVSVLVALISLLVKG